MRILYFGPYGGAGHFLWGPGRNREWDHKSPLPWKQIDGVLQPNSMFQFKRFDCDRAETEGEAILHRRGGWTAMCFWDRSVDKRGACNSNYFADGHYSFAEMVELAKSHFADRWSVMKFPVFESPAPRNALLCPKGVDYAEHRRSLVHRSGGPSADVLNTCVACGAVIGYWLGQWVELDSWTEGRIREGDSLE